MRELLTTCGELVGSALFSYGCWLTSPSLGYISAGVSVALFSWLASR